MIYDTIRTVPDNADLSFVPVAAATSLQLPVSVAGGPILFFNADDKAYFLPGEGVLLDFVACNIPFGFGQGFGLHVVSIIWRDPVGVPIPIPEFGASQIAIPDLCGGLKFGDGGLFIKAPRAVQGAKFSLALSAAALNVSMIGVPDALVSLGDPVLVSYWMGLRHTRAMRS